MNGAWATTGSRTNQGALLADGMEVKKLNEVPMSAMWTQTAGS